MEIAALGWGSLIWNAGQLPLKSHWRTDGPLLPIEFARESSDGRMTLVLVDGLQKSPTLWSLLKVDSLEIARIQLADREGVPVRNIKYSIGFWDSKSGNSRGVCAEEISAWAQQKGLDGVVWTNLKYGFKSTRDRFPKVSDVIRHINNLTTEALLAAEEYVRKAPAQIQTEFRSTFENVLGWEVLKNDAKS